MVEKRAGLRKQVQGYKMERGCAGTGCGWRGAWIPEMLDFHHRDPSTKEFNIGTNMALAPERVWAEIAKCDVLCRNCHQLEEYRLSRLEIPEAAGAVCLGQSSETCPTEGRESPLKSDS